VTRYLIKDSLSAAATRSSVTKFLTDMLGISTFELTTTTPRADMLRFEVPNIQRPHLLLLPLTRYLLRSTAALGTFMSSAIQQGFARPSALRRFLRALMTNR
jgi:hypothetical protein